MCIIENMSIFQRCFDIQIFDSFICTVIYKILLIIIDSIRIDIIQTCCRIIMISRISITVQCTPIFIHTGIRQTKVSRKSFCQEIHLPCSTIQNIIIITSSTFISFICQPCVQCRFSILRII